MKTKLITALRTAAKALENGTFFYEWGECSQCNCGAFVCALTGKSALELEDLIPKLDDDADGTWKERIGYNCPIVGAPSSGLFKELFSFGLTAQDLIGLEYLSDVKIVARVNLNKEQSEQVPLPRKWYQFTAPKFRIITKLVRAKLDYKNKEHAILYMRAWADLLQEEGAMDAVSAEPQHQEQLCATPPTAKL